MESPQVSVVQIESPIIAVGKAFNGSYAFSPEYASQVRDLLLTANAPFIPNKILGVYYDNPETTSVENLRCFQGFFLQNEDQFIDPPLSRVALEGKYLYTKVSGDPAKAIFAGYNAIFKYVQEYTIALRSNAGYQVSTFENNSITTEIYMEIL